MRASDSGVSPKSGHDLRTIGRSSRHSVWILGGVLYRGSSFNLAIWDFRTGKNKQESRGGRVEQSAGLAYQNRYMLRL